MRAFRFTGVLRPSAFVGAVVIASSLAPAVAQEKPAGKPSKSDDVGLPLPKPPPPTTVKNPDESTTTTTYPWGGQTTAVTTDSNGETVSTVTETPLRDGGQRTSIITGNTTVTVEYDGKGTIRSLVKTDLDKGTTNQLEYDDKGELVKASVFQFPVEKKGDVFQVGQGDLVQVYDVQNTPSGRPERYNKDKNKFEPITGDDWSAITDRLNAVANDIKSIRDQFAPIEKPVAAKKPTEPEDELAPIREEAAREPMRMPREGSVLPPPEPPEWLKIDPCLVGTWECVSYREADNKYITGGGTGFRVTFTPDGTETVDYGPMKPIMASNDTVSYIGKASAQISAKNGMARLESMVDAGARLNAVSRAIGLDWKPKLPGLGAGGLGSAKGMTSYKCDGDSLEYQTSAAGDQHPNCTVKLTRVSR
jgi:hypothetical protein